ncbi:clathrin interactor 1 isoform X2 [Lingula anatina]|uniref:Clathrin interactor 1 isoform X2 n=1 Tax=Lingula anatina TaxID=7574 RepID=A0A1S3IIU7_LINAN|nr:clathrin interactor 1 isoform X2 [Lingula anatina]|eukprot:XP_013397811.1 clathrin interactor 1 isoform X2 [Lingula anatina]
MWKIREITDKVTNVVMNYSEVESKVREATNDDAWGPTGSLMQEIAHFTFTYEHFPEVMGMLWKRMLTDSKKNWRRTYKALLLLNYLIRNGSERVVTSAREHIYDLRGLEPYQFIDEHGKDQGINVRQKTKDLLDFIQDDDRLREERKKAKKNKDKYTGISGEAMSIRHGGYSDRYGEEPNRFSSGRSQIDEFDAHDRQNRQSLAQEALGKVKEIWNRSRGYEDSPADRDSDNEIGWAADASDFKEDSFGNRDYNKNEFKDDDESFTMERTHTTRTERITSRKNNRQVKKIDLGAAAGFGRVSESDSRSHTSETRSPDLLDSSGGTFDPFTELDARHKAPSQGSQTPQANGDFADFSQFQSASSAALPAAPTPAVAASSSQSASNEFADFSSFSSASTQSPQKSSSALDDLLSPAPLQPMQPASMGAPSMGQPLMGQTSMAQPMMGQPMMGQSGMTQTSMTQPMMGQTSGAQSMMGQPLMGQTSMAQPMMGQTSMAQPSMGQPMMGQTSMAQPMMGQPMMGQSGIMQPMMGQMGMNNQMPGHNMAAQPMSGMQGMGMGQNMDSPVGQTPASVQSLTMTSMQATPSTNTTAGSVSNQPPSSKSSIWSNTPVNINLDGLSPANKFQKGPTSPSMKQLQQQQQIAGAQSPMMSNMYPQNQMYAGPSAGMQGMTQGMGKMSLGQPSTGMMNPGMGMGMQQQPGMMSGIPAGMAMTTPVANNAALQSRANQAFGSFGNFGK